MNKSVFFNAVADFSSVSKEARKAKRALRALKREAIETNAAMGGAAIKNAAALNSQSKAVDSLAKSSNKASTAQDKYAEGMKKAFEAAGNLATAQRDASEEADGLSASLKGSTASLDANIKAAVKAHQESEKLANKKKKEKEETDKLSSSNSRLTRTLAQLRRQLTKTGKSANLFKFALGGLKLGGIISGVVLLTQSLVALGGALTAVLGAMGPMLGVLGALPGLLGAAAASVGVLFLGFGGLSDAVSGFAKAQGSAAKTAKANAKAQKNAARAVTRAEKNLVKSKKNLVRAQEGIGKAREDAIRQLKELKRLVAGAALDEEEASLALDRARADLVSALNDPNATGLDVRQAQLAVRQAEQGLKDVRDANAENAKALEEAEKKGIEGSDEVVAAQERLVDAEESVADAAEAVSDALDAQKEAAAAAAGAAASAGEAYNNLTKEGREVVASILAIKDVIGDLRKSVQEEMFPGFNDALQDILALLPQLEDELDDVGAAFGRLFSSLGDELIDASFVSDVETLMGRMPDQIDALSEIINNLLSAFTDIAVEAEVLVDWLTDLSVAASEAFASFAADGREDGTLAESFERTIEALERMGGILYDLGGIFRAVFQAGADTGNDLLDTFAEMLEKQHEFLDSTEGRNTLKEWFEAAKPVAQEVFTFFTELTKAIGGLANTKNLGAEGGILGALKALNDGLFGAVDEGGERVGGALNRMLESFAESGIVDSLVKVFVSLADVLAELSEHTSVIEVFLDVFGTFLDIIKRITEIPGGSEAIIGLILAFKSAKIAGGFLSGLQELKTAFAFLSKGKKKGTGTKEIGLLGKAFKKLKGAGPGIKKFFGVLATGFGSFKKIGPVIGKVISVLRVGLVTAFKAVLAALGPWGLVIAGVILALVLLWKKNEAFRNFIKDAWAKISQFVKDAWEYTIKPALAATAKFITEKVIPAIKVLWEKAKEWFGKIGAVVKTLWNNVLKPYLELVKKIIFNVVIPAIKALWNIWKDQWDRIAGAVSTAFDIIKGVFETLKKALSGVGSFLGSIFSGAVNAVKVPVEFIVNKILNPAVKAINKVLDFVGLDGVQIPTISFGSYSPPGIPRGISRNRGGSVPGSGISDSVAARLTPGEFVINKGAAKALGYDQLMYLNSLGRGDGTRRNTGGPIGGAATRPSGGESGMATEGIWDKAKSITGDALGKVMDLGRNGASKGLKIALDGLSNLAHRMPGAGTGVGGMFTGLMDKTFAAATKFVKGVESSGEGGKLTGGSFARNKSLWPRGAPGKLAPNTRKAVGYIRDNFGLSNIGTLGNRPNKSDHPIGKALDAMTGKNTGLGTRIAKTFVDKASQFGTKYVIWHDQINSGSGWRPYVHPNVKKGITRNNPTLAHRDHVHVSFLNKGGGVGRIPRSGRGFNSGGFAKRMGSGLAAPSRVGGLNIPGVSASSRVTSNVSSSTGASIGTLVVNNPIRERASDTVPRTLRRASYLRSR